MTMLLNVHYALVCCLVLPLVSLSNSGEMYHFIGRQVAFVL